MPLARLADITLFYREVGSGEPCLVLHGGLGLDHTYLHPWLDPLGDVLRLVYYDHRGNGRSSRPPLETITHAQLVEDADALRAHLGFERVAVMASSHGGFIALQYALRHPHRISHLILIGSAPSYDYAEELRANVLRRGGTPAMLAALEDEPQPDDTWIAEKFRTLAPLYFHRPSRELADQVFGRTVWSGSGGARGRQLARSYEVTDRLGSIRVPTLILVGRDDFVTPPSQAERLHRGVPSSTLVVFERSGHFPYIEEPDAFFATVRAWLARTPSELEPFPSPH